MKAKDYDKKRKELKEEKREGRKSHFESTNERKKFVEGVNKTFRSLKRSEKQNIKKNLMDKAYGLDDEQWDDEDMI